jgi:hypothetical protein
MKKQEGMMEEEVYAVDIESIVFNLQIKMIENVLEAKYSEESSHHAKIFRVMKKFKKIEDKKVKDIE